MLFVEDITSTNYQDGVAAVPESVYALVVSYSLHPRTPMFGCVYVTDFTRSDDLMQIDVSPRRFRTRNGSLTPQQVLTADMFLSTIGSFLKEASSKVDFTFPEPKREPNDDIYKHRFIVKLSGMISRYRYTVDFKKARVDLLSKEYIQEHAEDEHLRSFLGRLRANLGEDPVIEQRYGLSEFWASIDPESSGLAAVGQESSAFSSAGNAVVPDTYGMSVLKRYDEDAQQREPNEKDSKWFGQLKTEAPDSLIDTQMIGPEPIGSLDSGYSFGSMARSTTIDRLIEDTSLSGTFQVDGVKLVGYLPSDSPTVVEKEITDQLELVLVPESSDPSSDGSGRVIYRKFIRVKFQSQDDALDLLELEESGLNDENVRNCLDKLIGNPARAQLTRVRDYSVLWAVDYWAIRKFDLVW